MLGAVSYKGGCRAVSVTSLRATGQFRAVIDRMQEKVLEVAAIGANRSKSQAERNVEHNALNACLRSPTAGEFEVRYTSRPFQVYKYCTRKALTQVLARYKLRLRLGAPRFPQTVPA